jgi:DNA-binding NtrC family response regulator/tetratricopeptide (TPR) repeat protein
VVDGRSRNDNPSKNPPVLPRLVPEQASVRGSACEAAQQALAQGDLYLESDSWEEALECYLRIVVDLPGSGLSTSDIARLYLRMARSYYELGRHDEGRACCRSASALAPELDDPLILAESDIVLSRIESDCGRFELVLASAQAAYDVLVTLPDSPLLAAAGERLGMANAELGKVEKARDYFIDCLVCLKRLGDQAGLAHAYNNLGVLAKRTGDLTGALRCLQKSLDIDRRLGRSAMVAARLRNIGNVLFRLSRWDEAERSLVEARDICVKIGAARRLVAVQGALGSIARARGDWETARACFADVLERSRRAGYLKAEVLALEFQAELEADQGEYEAALEILDDALEAAERLSSDSDAVGDVLVLRAEALLELGKVDEAEVDCLRALALSRKIHNQLQEGTVLRVLGGMRYATGEVRAAAELIGQAEDVLRTTGESFELAKCALTEGAGLTRLRNESEFQIDRVEARLSIAASLFGQLGATPWIARSELASGEAFLRAGQWERSRRYLERARLRFDTTGSRHWVAAADRALGELDERLAASGTDMRSGRYRVIAEGHRLLKVTEPSAGDLYRVATDVARAVSAGRLLLASVSDDGVVVTRTAVDCTGRGAGSVSRFVASAAKNCNCGTPVVVSGRSGGAGMPDDTGAVALLPVAVGDTEGGSYVLCVDRPSSQTSVAFTRSDIEFLGAAAGLLAATHARMHEAVSGNGDRGAQDNGHGAASHCGVIAQDPHMLAILAEVDRLRDSRVPVLIQGESGVGKELVARAIHEGGTSRTGSFVALNAGAIAPHLQESELFGHVKGAFTGAEGDREGLVGAASGGTLFLDEIAEMSTALQVKLLRFLQDGEYRRVGESRTRKSDARVISATNRDLANEVRAGRFRRDIFHRLRTFTVDVPPLRDHPEDIPLLMEHFVRLCSKREGKRIRGFSRKVRELFAGSEWRENNVRELENEVRRAVVLCTDGDAIDMDKISPELRVRNRSGSRASGRPTLKDDLEDIEKRRIFGALNTSGWNKKKAADELGISRTGLLTKMSKYGIPLKR